MIASGNRRHVLFTLVAAAGGVAIGVGILSQGCAPPLDGDDGDDGNGVTGKFAGAQRCEICHSRHYDNWLDTSHARALASLEAIGQHANPVCLACHTVGFGEADGFVDRATTPEFADVQCESCHGPSAAHARDVTNRDLRPAVPVESEACGKCHNDFHHPTFDEWSASGHARVRESVAASFTQGRSLTACGICHSGDVRHLMTIRGENVPDDLLLGRTAEEMNAITCTICHDPHRRTGFDAVSEEDRDRQLRYPVVVAATQNNTVAGATDPARFNLCGQCHHSRGRMWTDTARAPHHSVQANVYFGEMPVPAGTEPLVPNERSLHAFVPKQCVTCHMLHRDFESEEAPAHTGHLFRIDTAGCSGIGCHTAQEAEADLARRRLITQAALADLASRLGDVSTWEYTFEGGPDEEGQAEIPDEIKKVRFMYHYILSDGSWGTHNPQYVDSMLNEADRLLTSLGM